MVTLPLETLECGKESKSVAIAECEISKSILDLQFLGLEIRITIALILNTCMFEDKIVEQIFY